MNEYKSKLIVFASSIQEENIGNIKYVKFLNDNSAIFYNPLVAPRHFNDYIKENNIVKAYEITDDNVLEKYANDVYTFTPNSGIYEVNKGITVSNKYILLVDSGMEIETNLPKYSYVFKDNKFYVKKLNKKTNKEYCYITDGEYVNSELKKIMIPVYEAVDGILSIDDYSFKHDIKTKKYIPKKTK